MSDGIYDPSPVSLLTSNERHILAYSVPYLPTTSLPHQGQIKDSLPDGALSQSRDYALIRKLDRRCIDVQYKDVCGPKSIDKSASANGVVIVPKSLNIKVTQR